MSLKNSIFILITVFSLSKLHSQDLEPRSLSVMPIKGNFAVASYAYSSGNILVDNALPVKDLNAKLNNFVVAYARSFKLFNRLAKVDFIAPYSFGEFSGKVGSIDSSVSKYGFADPLARISVILIGAKPLSISEYANQTHKKFKLGVSFRIRPPLGKYDNTKFINIGANRWAYKFGLAASYTVAKKLVFEAQFATWIFTENKEFWNGNSVKQKPLIGAQIHTTYIIKPGIWVSLSIGQSGLGETIVNGVEKDDLQQNSRFGAAFAYKLNKNNSIKIAFTSGVSTRYGANFTTFLVAYQFMWFDKNKVKN